MAIFAAQMYGLPLIFKDEDEEAQTREENNDGEEDIEYISL